MKENSVISGYKRYFSFLNQPATDKEHSYRTMAVHGRCELESCNRNHCDLLVELDARKTERVQIQQPQGLTDNYQHSR